MNDESPASQAPGPARQFSLASLILLCLLIGSLIALWAVSRNRDRDQTQRIRVEKALQNEITRLRGELRPVQDTNTHWVVRSHRDRDLGRERADGIIPEDEVQRVNAMPLAEMKAELLRLRDKLGYLTVADPTKVHVRAAADMGPLHWRWRVHVPRGTKWNIHIALRSIPAKGVAKYGSDQPLRHTGEFTIDLKARPMGNGKWKPVPLVGALFHGHGQPAPRRVVHQAQLRRA